MNRAIVAHLSILFAAIFWGLMAPLGKDAMSHGIDGLSMVTFRVVGGATLFWLTSLFAPREFIPVKDVIKLAGAAILGLALNQGCFTIGLSMTSPINASIITTSMPIFAMILSALILKEPITIKKAIGVILGCTGAATLILSSASSTGEKVGNIWGDLICMSGQLSYALFLTLFNPLVKRYSVFTVNKWMFLWASIFILPFSINRVTALPWSNFETKTLLETAFVVFCGTYMSYLLIIVAQKTLRPTVVSVYNYVQPIVAVTVSILTGQGILSIKQGIAILFVFTGVWLVIRSKSKRDLEKSKVKN